MGKPFSRTQIINAIISILVYGGAILRPVHLLKIEAAKSYLKGVSVARRAFLMTTGYLLGLLCLAFGALMVIAGLILYLPITLEAKALVLLIGGGALFLIAAVGLLIASRERTWLEFSKGKDLVEELTDR